MKMKILNGHNLHDTFGDIILPVTFVAEFTMQSEGFKVNLSVCGHTQVEKLVLEINGGSNGTS